MLKQKSLELNVHRFCVAVIAIKAKSDRDQCTNGGYLGGDRLDQPLVPFDASVMPAVWSSSSLVFKLFPKEASLPGGVGGRGESEQR